MHQRKASSDQLHDLKFVPPRRRHQFDPEFGVFLFDDGVDLGHEDKVQRKQGQVREPIQVNLGHEQP